jgi:hypothetical protein
MIKKAIDGLKDFIVTEHVIAGDLIYFIRPSPAVQKWSKSILNFRSSMWTEEGELISASYPKFFNLEENPDIDPIDYSKFNEFKFIEKVDGSTLIVSRYRGTTIMRTRGTIDATVLPTGSELAMFRNLYTKFFEDLETEDTVDKSYIFEWYSPKNRIVINYGDSPIFTLTNVVKHSDYGLTRQDDLDAIAAIYGFLRPIYYSASSMPEMISTIRALKGKEGVCVYYNNDQNIRKLKGLEYLKKHAFRSHCTVSSILSLAVDQGLPDKEGFIHGLEKEFDFECIQFATESIEIVYRAIQGAYARLSQLRIELEKLSHLSQKDFAIQILPKYTKIETGILFSLRKSPELTLATLQKLIEQYIIK